LVYSHPVVFILYCSRLSTTIELVTAMPRTIIVGAGIIGASTAYFLSHSTSRSQDDTITVVDPNPPASGASGKAAGILSRNWTGIATASLEALSFRLHKDLAQQYGGAEKWGYRPCEILAVEVGNKGADSPEVDWGERHKNATKIESAEVLKWVKPYVIRTQALLGEPKSWAQW
jgi:glycine/D-amino acid oxidase-like deaminating enzyme